MAETISTTALAWSPGFVISLEDLRLDYFTGPTDVDIDGVTPPTLGSDQGYSSAMDLWNQWSPWIDEKVVEPKYDGVCQYLGLPSNRPTFIKDYHTITLMRAADYILAAQYQSYIQATASNPYPLPPPGYEEQ